MKVLDSAQIRDWDLYTIGHEPVASIDLMERAAVACVRWLEEHSFPDHAFAIFCGKGNNGGDGLAIARLLLERECAVDVYILEFGHLGTSDFQENLKRLHQLPQSAIHFVQGDEQFPQLSPGTIIIDALYGSGLNRPLGGVSEGLVKHLNDSGCTVIAIDVPSGMPVDQPATGEVIRAAFTLTFQVHKVGLLLQENGPFIGHVHVLNIGLSEEFYAGVETRY
ncbi:MAG TPA: NAD(P)H-hydrate epimerase, partial [Chitinophagaceae bacterium]